MLVSWLRLTWHGTLMTRFHMLGMFLVPQVMKRDSEFRSVSVDSMNLGKLRVRRKLTPAPKRDSKVSKASTGIPTVATWKEPVQEKMFRLA
jgi:hypothetical protein